MKYMFSGYESRSLHPSGTAGYDRKRPANNLQYHFVVIIYVGIPISNLNRRPGPSELSQLTEQWGFSIPSLSAAPTVTRTRKRDWCVQHCVLYECVDLSEMYLVSASPISL